MYEGSDPWLSGASNCGLLPCEERRENGCFSSGYVNESMLEYNMCIVDIILQEVHGHSTI